MAPFLSQRELEGERTLGTFTLEKPSLLLGGVRGLG